MTFFGELELIDSAREGHSLKAGLCLSDSNSSFFLLPERLTMIVVDCILLRYSVAIGLVKIDHHVFFLHVPIFHTRPIFPTTLPEIEKVVLGKTLRVQYFDVANLFLNFLIRLGQESNDFMTVDRRFVVSD